MLLLLRFVTGDGILLFQADIYLTFYQRKSMFFSMNALSLHLPVTSRGLTSNKSSQQLKELIPFEDDLIDLVKNIKFRKVTKMKSAE